MENEKHTSSSNKTQHNCQLSIINYQFRLKRSVFIAIIVTILASCSQGYTPKPRGFYRIYLPEKEYVYFDDKTYPYTYEIPTYAKVELYKIEGDKIWTNVNFPDFNATINLSYQRLRNNLNEHLADVMLFIDRHKGKASRIRELEFNDHENRVFGMIFDIRGSGVASMYQFYMTDSLRHFVRGALYFDHQPNNDSLAPVIDFLKADMDHLIETFQWRR
jgi:gliding motility-associated lipoprotein GldD